MEKGIEIMLDQHDHRTYTFVCMPVVQAPHNGIVGAKGLEVVLRKYSHALSPEWAHKEVAKEQKTRKNINK